MSTSPTLQEDEKLFAALGYWLSTVLSFIAPLIFYLMKKDESAFVKKHALQCLFFHLIFIAFNLALGFLGGIISLFTFGIGALLILLLQVPLFIGMWVYMIVLGIQIYQGQDKTIPVIDQLVHKLFPKASL